MRLSDFFKPVDLSVGRLSLKGGKDNGRNDNQRNHSINKLWRAGRLLYLFYVEGQRSKQEANGDAR